MTSKPIYLLLILIIALFYISSCERELFNYPWGSNSNAPSDHTYPIERSYHVKNGINQPETYCSACHGSCPSSQCLKGGELQLDGTFPPSCYTCHGAEWLDD